MPIHSISSLLKHLHTSHMDVGCILGGFGGPIDRQNNKNTHQKGILASKMLNSRGIRNVLSIHTVGSGLFFQQILQDITFTSESIVWIT
jgi:hypothetical protein